MTRMFFSVHNVFFKDKLLKIAYLEMHVIWNFVSTVNEYMFCKIHYVIWIAAVYDPGYEALGL